MRKVGPGSLELVDDGQQLVGLTPIIEQQVTGQKANVGKDSRSL